jgi:tRNA(Ile2) C34 agmatinyltransferase TiaS
MYTNEQLERMKYMVPDYDHEPSMDRVPQESIHDRIERHRDDINWNHDKIMQIVENIIPKVMRFDKYRSNKIVEERAASCNSYTDTNSLRDEIQALTTQVTELSTRVEELESQATKKSNPTLEPKCIKCGDVFKPKNPEYRKCHECHTKIRRLQCRLCKRGFTQKHFTHKLCLDCVNLKSSF